MYQVQSRKRKNNKTSHLHLSGKGEVIQEKKNKIKFWRGIGKKEKNQRISEVVKKERNERASEIFPQGLL